jgi:hypothetical protein
MITARKNKKDVHEWIEKVIESCRTSTHLEGASKLIDLFDRRYNDFTLTRKLQDFFIDFVHNNLIIKPKKNTQ